MDKKKYSDLVKKNSPSSKSLKNCLWAFFVGGTICTLGEFLVNMYLYMGFDIDKSRLMCSVSLIVLSGVLTSLGWYSRIAKRAGAGTLVPITGFANAVVSPAIEFKCEGYITGVGCKMFVIAGPVIVYGIIASMIYGLALYFNGGFGI